MKQTTFAILLMLAVIPVALSVECNTVPQSSCGVSGGDCQYFTWTNGTCTAPTTCPTSPTITIWSNSSYNCIPCSGSTSSVCTSCTSSGFFFNSNLNFCTTCSDVYGINCLTCSSTACLTCGSSTTLSTNNQSCQDGRCSIPFCQTCTDSTTCQTCDSQHKLLQNVCVCIVDNCELCSNKICNKCFDGYALEITKLKCSFICIDSCSSCTDLNSCTLCNTGYYYNSGTNQCLPTCTSIDANCAKCSTTTICDSCNSNYVLSASGAACNQVCADPNCNTCATSSSICTQCNIGYKVNSTTNTCGTDVCFISDCLICESSTTCSQCNNYFKLSSDSKTCEANCGVANCLSCSSASTCQVCITGYRIVSNSCNKICSVANCAVCRTSSTCSTCDSGFLLSDDNEICTYNCGITGCINCNSKTTCSACYTGLTLASGGTACILNCQAGFYLNATTSACIACPSQCATCDNNGICLSCLNLYYLNPTDLKCKACSSVSSCYNCNSGNSACTVCLTGFYPINGVCSDTTGCTVTDCLSCISGSTTTCFLCRQGYSKSADGSSCSKIVCSGNQFPDGSVCTCGVRSYFKSGVCTACSDNNCLTCSSSSCSSCVIGFYPSGFTCVACSTSNCKTCDANGCITCREHFVMKGTSCISGKSHSISHAGVQIVCPIGCKICDINNNANLVCRVALDGYVLVKGVIFKCDESCATCHNKADGSGNYANCITCNNGYFFIAGKCSKCTGAHALTCKSKDPAYSLTCTPGYNAEGGICLACSVNCLKCQNKLSGSCDYGGCADGYFQSKNFTDCVKCVNGCLNCGSDPNVCYNCGDYKYLSNSICYACSSNCITCTSAASCSACEYGYSVASDGTCKASNINGCVTYDANIACTACDESYTLSSGTCSLSMSCNSTSTCINCKYNYYLQSGKCISCPTISNCNSCNIFDKTKCSDCASGYYVSISGACATCSLTGCLTCSTSTICSKASDGYFLIVDASGAATGQIAACGGLCQTCNLYALGCKTCQSGAHLRGYQCISNNYKNVTFTGYLKVYGPTAVVANNYYLGSAYSVFSRIHKEFGALLGFSFGDFDKHAILNYIRIGSVVTSYTITSQGIVNDPATVLKAVTDSTFTDLGILSSSVVNSGGSSSSSTNLGLVLGVSIPLAILLIIIIIFLKHRNNKEEEKDGLDSTQKQIEYEEGQQF